MSCNISIPLQRIIDDVAEVLAGNYISVDNPFLNESVLTDTTFRGDITMDTEARNALCAILQTCGITAIELEWLDRPTVADMVAVSEVVAGEVVVSWKDLDTLITEGIVGKVQTTDVLDSLGVSQEEINTDIRNELGALPFEDGVLADTFVTISASNGYPETTLDELTTSLREDLQGISGNTINVERFGITGDNTDITAQLMQSIVDNPTYTKYYFPDGAYSFSGFLLEKDGIELNGQSKDGTIFNITQAPSGVSFRCGKRGAMSDAREDNLPVYNGVNPLFTLDDYSPATPEYPRYKDIRVDNVTLNFIGNHATGFDFYRIDGGGYDVKCTFNGTPTMGNVIRNFFCTNLWIPELDTDDNTNATFNTFFYWSYGIKGRRWNIGKGGNTSLEMKHAVNVDVGDITVDGDVFSHSIGYGSHGINITTLNSLGGTVRLKASEEFDFSKNIKIGDLKIHNPTGTGFNIGNISGLHIGTYDINAAQPVYLTFQEFYAFSNDTDITPVKNSANFVYDGNYDTSELSSGYTKYFEARNIATLIDSSFGVGVLRGCAGNHVLIAKAGGIADVFGADGKVIHKKVPSSRGYNEAIRRRSEFTNSYPYAVKNVDFGKMELQVTGASATLKPINSTLPLDNCKGEFYLKNATQQYAEILFMFNNTKLGVFSDKALEQNLYPLTLRTMNDSELYGLIRPKGRAILLESTGAIYADGFSNSKISFSFIYPTAPTSSPPIYSNLSTPEKWRGLLDVSGSNFYAEDGTSIATQVAGVVKHTGETPSGYSGAGAGAGAGVYTEGALVDGTTPVYRLYTGATGSLPTFLPNYVGALSKNSAFDEWCRGKSLTGWSPL